MPIYKVLRFRGFPNKDSRGAVETRLNGNSKDKSETRIWGSLEEALEELGEAGWEIQTPVYNPVSESAKDTGGAWLEALILVNRSLDASQELARQIDRAKKDLEKQQTRLKQAKENLEEAQERREEEKYDDEKSMMESAIDRTQKQLELLLEKRDEKT